MTTYDELVANVDSNGGLHRATMEELRDAHGASKLGVHVRSAIRSELASRGLGVLPNELPSYQHEEVRVFRLGSPIADIVNAVVTPSASGDMLLREVGGHEAEVLNKIRELVCN